MTGGEEECEDVIPDPLLVERSLFRPWLRTGSLDLGREDAVLLLKHPVSPDPVDAPVLRGGQKPG